MDLDKSLVRVVPGIRQFLDDLFGWKLRKAILPVGGRSKKGVTQLAQKIVDEYNRAKNTGGTMSEKVTVQLVNDMLKEMSPASSMTTSRGSK
jgi:hypothetical protein